MKVKRAFEKKFQVLRDIFPTTKLWQEYFPSEEIMTRLFFQQQKNIKIYLPT